MNAIIYIRVSTTEQAENGYSLKTQKEICQEYANRNNYKVLRIFKEEGESAKTSNRTELQKMLIYIKENRNKIDALIIHKLDRLSRDVYDALNLRIVFDKLKIKLLSVTEPFDDSPIGRFISTTFSSIAQLDNDIRSERAVGGMKQAVKEGRWLWEAPYGYKFEKTNGKSYLTIKEDEAKIVKGIFQLFDDGYRGKELIDRIRKMGFNLYKQKLAKMLRKTVYKGKIKVEKWFGDKEIDGLHEAIIDEELFDKVQFKLGVYDNFQKPKSRIHKDFPLRGVIYCPFCGNKLTGAFSTGRNHKYPYYRCSTKGCSFKSKNKYLIENSFRSFLEKIIPNKDLLRRFKKAIIDTWNDNNKIQLSSINKLNNERNQIDRKIDSIIELHSKGLINDSDFSKRYKELKNKHREIEIAINDHKNNNGKLDDYLDKSFEVLEDLPSFWDKSSPELQNKLLSFMFPEGFFYNCKNIGTTKIATIFKVFEGTNAEKSTLVRERGLEPLQVLPH